MSISDLLYESLAGILQRPARSVLTMLGTVLGIGAFVAVLGITATANGQIDKRFTVFSATEVRVEDVGDKEHVNRAVSLPADASERVKVLNGVVDAAVFWNIALRNPNIAVMPGRRSESKGLALTAAEPATFAVVHSHVSNGRVFDAFHQQRAEPVSVLGAAAAAQLGISRLDGHPAVFVDGLPYTVVGIIDDAVRMPELMFSVIIPTRTAIAHYGEPTHDRPKMIIETRPGAAGQIASQTALALLPNAPQELKVIAPPDPQTLRTDVNADLNALFVLLASLSLVVGAIGIANTTLIGVLERANEIGLRRSLGARPIHIACQFLSESAVLGFLGALVGTTVGTAIVLTVAISHKWTVLLPTWTVLTAPLIGAGTGLVAGLYPSLRAARIEPAEALRR